MEAIELLAHKGARRLFEVLRAYPRRQFTINELAGEAGLPFTTTWKLVQKFERASIVEVSVVGKNRAVRYRKSPFSGTIEGILRLNASYQSLSIPALKRILKAKPGVSEAYLFGSVARGQERLESDVDVALLLKRRIDVPSLISSIYEKYGVKVVPVTFDSKDEFDDFLSGKSKVRLA
jgi:predicted nucleotidyltransferase